MNNSYVFPSKADLQDEWNGGWFGTDANQLNIYVQLNYITAADFQQITGQPYNA